MMNHSPSVTKSTIDFSSLLNSMRSTSGGEGMTTAEICESLGKSELTVRKMLRKAMVDGTVRRTEKYKDCLDGRARPVSAYVICEPGTIIREQVVI